MSLLISNLGIGVAAFTSTNIDDAFLLAAFFADARLRSRSIVVGQYLGIGVLVGASVLMSAFALALPDGWVALLGVLPLLLGFMQLLALRGSVVGADSLTEGDRAEYQRLGARGTLRSQAVAVAAVTVANGGDNIGVYVPLFATDFGAISIYVFTFAVMTGLWCGFGYWLVNNPIVGGSIRRYGRLILPVVLIALGVYILSGALILMR